MRVGKVFSYTDIFIRCKPSRVVPNKIVYSTSFRDYNEFSSVATESEGVELNGLYRKNTGIIKT